jgi:hypothetical protein
VRPVEGVRPVTETSLDVILEGFRALALRFARIAGDQRTLADDILEDDSAKVSPRVEQWGNEADRLARELAHAIEVIDRVVGPPAGTPVEGEAVDEAAITATLDLDEVAECHADDE